LKGIFVARTKPHRLAQVKVRLPEVLRRELEREAEREGRSMNTEIVVRLHQSFRKTDQATQIAEALLKGLDADVVAKIDDILNEWRHDDYNHEPDELT
jgi:hypothetical protein